MLKRERQRELVRLIHSSELGTQAELVTALHVAGIDVVQSTVSRDVAELGLVKVRGKSGRLVYAMRDSVDHDKISDLQRAISRWAQSVETSGNLVIITTPSGYADPLAQAIDEANHPLVLGTIAGENTIFLATREEASGSQLRDSLIRDSQIEEPGSN